MRDFVEPFLLVCIGIMLGLIISKAAILRYEKNAIKYGCAQYDLNTGGFVWIEK